MKKEKLLNKTIKKFNRGYGDFEIDRLEDTKPNYVYHLFFMDGSERSKSVGGDFTSVEEAIEYSKDWSNCQNGDHKFVECDEWERTCIHCGEFE